MIPELGSLVPYGAYGTVAVSYIGTKIALSLCYDPDEIDPDTTPPSASVIIPEYNEDPELFRKGMESVVQSDYPLTEVWVVDDGSDDTRAFAVAQEYADAYEHVHARRLDENQGKRHAQAHAFRAATPVDVFITMDSDTVLEADAFEHLCAPFDDPDVAATTGYPKVINKGSNLLTQLIDMRYWVAFNVERAAQSVLGVVSCCCGVLSAYRYDVVMDNLDAYTGQTFRGKECTFGDDRHLTAMALQGGDVKYQSTATSLTAAPETVADYLTQQTRWMRSFWRESALALTWAPGRSLALTVMLIIDMLLPFALVSVGFGSVMIQALVVSVSIPALSVAVVAAIAYLRSSPYLRQNPRTYALSPIYAGLYLCVLLPLSFYALATVTASGWGTR